MWRLNLKTKKKRKIIYIRTAPIIKAYNRANGPIVAFVSSPTLSRIILYLLADYFSSLGWISCHVWMLPLHPWCVSVRFVTRCTSVYDCSGGTFSLSALRVCCVFRKNYGDNRHRRNPEEVGFARGSEPTQNHQHPNGSWSASRTRTAVNVGLTVHICVSYVWMYCIYKTGFFFFKLPPLPFFFSLLWQSTVDYPRNKIIFTEIVGKVSCSCAFTRCYIGLIFYFYVCIFFFKLKIKLFLVLFFFYPQPALWTCGACF